MEAGTIIDAGRRYWDTCVGGHTLVRYGGIAGEFPTRPLYCFGSFARLESVSLESTDKKGKVGAVGRRSKIFATGLGLIVAGIFLVAYQPILGAEPEPAAEKANKGPVAEADPPNPKVATVLGRDIFRSDVDPPAKWLEDREKYVKLHGEKMGFETPDAFRMNKLKEAIWTPICDKYIPKKELEPTDEELQEFIVRQRQGNALMQQEQKERQKKLQAEADKLEKLLPSQDDEDQAETRQKIQKMRKEIAAIEKSFEYQHEIQNRDKDHEKFFARWWVGHWKQQQWFYKRYGGRVIYQQVGPEAIDAMRDFLKDAEAKKDFVIHDPDLNAKFWEPLTRARPGVFVPNPDKVFEHPWSIMDRSVNDNKPPAAPASGQAAKAQPPAYRNPAFETVGNGSSAAAFPMDLSLEDDAKAEISVKLDRKKTLLKTQPGVLKADLTAVPDGQYHLYVQCPGYATKMLAIQKTGDRISQEQLKFRLYRNRYVILRCAFNTRGGRNLEGDGVEEQRVALSQWTGAKYFSHDWWITQRSRAGGETPCDVPYIDFHYIAPNFGIVKPPKDVSYEQMKEAPEEGYKGSSRTARKGLVLFCRVIGDDGKFRGYGKLLVEDVTETPPKDVPVLVAPQ
jgi:hypothetical protein